MTSLPEETVANLILLSAIPTLVTLGLGLFVSNSMENLRFASRDIGRIGKCGVRYSQLCMGHVFSLSALSLVPGVSMLYKEIPFSMELRGHKSVLGAEGIAYLLMLFILISLIIAFVLPLRMDTRQRTLRRALATHFRAGIANSLGIASLGCVIFFAFAGSFR